LIDSYAEGLLEKHEFEPRITRLRQRLTQLEEQRQQLIDMTALQTEIRLIVGRLEDFAAKIDAGLEDSDWLSKREMIRALVKRVEVTPDRVNVIFRVDAYPGEASPEKKSLQLHGGSSEPLARQHIPPHVGQVYGVQIPQTLRVATTPKESPGKRKLPLRQICRWHAGTGVRLMGCKSPGPTCPCEGLAGGQVCAVRCRPK
jgi:hypothetical protein